MSDNPSGSDTGVMDAAQTFVNADVFYGESEPEVPTDEDVETETEEVEPEGDTEEVEESEEEQEVSGDDKPTTVKYEYDEEAGTYSFKSNGETVQANIEKLIENYSKGEGFTKKTTDLANRDKARAAEHSQAMATIKKQEQEFLALTESLSGLLEEEQIDWDELRDTDPSEYLKKKEQVQARRDKLKGAYQKVLDKRDKEMTDRAAKEFKQLQKVMEWDTQEKVSAGINKIIDYCSSIGMETADVNEIYDHRIYRAFNDAAKYRELLAKKEKAVKEVKSAPKSVKSGKPTPQKKQKTAADILYGT